MEKEGKSAEKIARYLHKKRRDIGLKYKDRTPPDKRKVIKERNTEKYGDPLGPTIDYLRNNKNRSWEQIIESATRTGGDDINFSE